MLARARSLAVWLLICTLSLHLSPAGSIVVPDKSFVNLTSLPEPFDDAKLPVEQEDASTCHQFLGCFEPVPIHHWKPKLEAETKFFISAKDGRESTIAFKKVVNCLHDEPETCDLYQFDLQALLDSPYDYWKRTIILVSGYRSKAPVDWEQVTKRYWFELEDVNVIVIDWSKSDNGIYEQTAVNTRTVARQATILLYYLAKLNGFDLNDESFAESIYITGHSLGAHVAGFVGMDLGGRIGRITGLDPAGPEFDKLPERFRLDRTDAHLVDAIHSNGGAVVVSRKPRLGTSLKSGHIDLYANDGSHQPSCSVDLFGCSHGKSSEYYTSFLRHELGMRKYLGDNYSSLYRLTAYSSDHYANFQNATSLLEACPESVNRDFFSSDLNKCSIPIDYTTWYSQLRQELEVRHNIDFSAQSTNNNSFFFYTSATMSEQMDHYLIRLSLAKRNLSAAAAVGPDQATMESDLIYQPDECDVAFDIQMKNMPNNRVQIKKYHLLDSDDHYKVLAPYLSTNPNSKYMLAKLDSEDFGSVESEAVPAVGEANKMLEIFPESIALRGFKINQQASVKKKNKNIFKSFLNNIGSFAQGKGWNGDKADEASCNLVVDSLAVRPLRRLRRNLVAYYSSRPDEPGESAKIVALREDEPVSQYIEPKYRQPATQDARLYLDSIFIGPIDESLVDELHSDASRADPTDLLGQDYQLDDTSGSAQDIPSGVSPCTWITLTSLLLVAIVALAMVNSSRKSRTADKQTLTLFPVSITNRAKL